MISVVTRLINKNNPKNIYCGHCEFYKHCGLYSATCENEHSPKYKQLLHYWNRCKSFVWRKDADYVQGC